MRVPKNNLDKQLEWLRSGKYDPYAVFMKNSKVDMRGSSSLNIVPQQQQHENKTFDFTKSDPVVKKSTKSMDYKSNQQEGSDFSSNYRPAAVEKKESLYSSKKSSDEFRSPNNNSNFHNNESKSQSIEKSYVKSQKVVVFQPNKSNLDDDENDRSELESRLKQIFVYLSEVNYGTQIYSQLRQQM